MTTIHYFRTVTRRGRCLYYWEPSARLRKAGFRPHRLPDDYAAAVAAAVAHNDAVAAWEAGGGEPVREEIDPRSVKAMIVAYQGSRFWPTAPRTQGDYARYLRMIEAWAGDNRADCVDVALVEEYYAALLATGRVCQANACMRVLRRLYAVGIRLKFATLNPAEKMGMKQPKRQRPVLIWTDAQVEAIVETADAMGRHSVGTAVTLNHWLGQRPGDMLALTRESYRDGTIHLRQSKTGARVELPVEVVPHLGRRLAEEAARVDALLAAREARRARRRGQAPAAPVVASIGEGGVVARGPIIVSEHRATPYTPSGFAHLFEEIRAEAARRHPDVPDLDKLCFVWLRHTAVTKMAEAGSELAEISAVTGHTLKSVTDIVEHYLVRTGRMSRSAFERRVKAAERARAGGGGKVRRVGTPVYDGAD